MMVRSDVWECGFALVWTVVSYRWAVYNVPRDGASPACAGPATCAASSTRHWPTGTSSATRTPPPSPRRPRSSSEALGIEPADQARLHFQ